MTAAPDFGVLLSLAYGTFVDRLHRHMHDEGFEGFTTRMGFVLRILGEEPRSLREVADVLEVSSPAALKLIDAMVADGYVTRVASPGDRRVRAITPTERGYAALAVARQFHADLEQQVATDIGPEDAAALRRGLEAVGRLASTAIPQVLRGRTGQI